MRGNPNFAIFAPKWQFAHDAYEGTEAIKQGSGVWNTCR